MKRLARWTLRVLVVLLVAIVAVAAWKWDEIQRLLAVNSLFEEDRIVENFSAMDRLFFHQPLELAGAQPQPWPERPLPMPELSEWVEQRAVTGLVVLKDGAIAHEGYFLGTSADDRRISWSVAKSYLSALIGIAHAEGSIESLDDSVTKYVPALVGTAYEGASIRNLLQMSSGVRFNEDYLDPNSDINRMGRVLALGGSMDEFAASLEERERSPGEAWYYVSIDTHVLGMVLRAATGRSVIDLLGDKLLRHLGLESQPYYVTDGYGTAFVLGGLNMMTRDYARFGQLYLQDGVWNGQELVPAAWVAESTAASAPTPEGALKYGYQWWVPADAEKGEFFARGIYGQYVYVNKPAGVVVAVNSADRRFRESGAFEQNLSMFRRITEALR